MADRLRRVCVGRSCGGGDNLAVWQGTPTSPHHVFRGSLYLPWVHHRTPSPVTYEAALRPCLTPCMHGRCCRRGDWGDSVPALCISLVCLRRAAHDDPMRERGRFAPSGGRRPSPSPSDGEAAVLVTGHSTSQRQMTARRIRRSTLLSSSTRTRARWLRLAVDSPHMASPGQRTGGRHGTGLQQCVSTRPPRLTRDTPPPPRCRQPPRAGIPSFRYPEVRHRADRGSGSAYDARMASDSGRWVSWEAAAAIAGCSTTKVHRAVRAGSLVRRTGLTAGRAVARAEVR